MNIIEIQGGGWLMVIYYYLVKGILWIYYKFDWVKGK